MAIRWRHWNRVLHRDCGYLCVGMTLIYALSGIALNHMDDWNPSYQISRQRVEWQGAGPGEAASREDVIGFLETHGVGDRYKKHYAPRPGQLKIFFEGGSAVVDLRSGVGVVERLRRRPVFYEVNFLHYNPKRLWTWFSDLFCVGLMLLAVTGLFVLKGRQGITGRGAWLTGIGVLLPLVLLLLYL